MKANNLSREQALGAFDVAEQQRISLSQALKQVQSSKPSPGGSGQPITTAQPVTRDQIAKDFPGLAPAFGGVKSTPVVPSIATSNVQENVDSVEEEEFTLPPV